VKFLHIRAVDDSGHLLPTSGATLGYEIVDDMINLQWAVCHETDRFNFDRARMICIGRMIKHGPIDSIPLVYPLTETLIEWCCANIVAWPIEIYKDVNNRWVSNFQPFYPNGIPDDDEGINIISIPKLIESAGEELDC